MAAKKTTEAPETPVVDLSGRAKAAAIRSASAARFGDELIKSISEDVPPLKASDCHSWGVPSINYICTGNPLAGVPRGKIVEVFGPESSGKTTLTLLHVVEVQRKGGAVGFMDAEHALHLQYAQDLGVDIPAMLFSQPDYGEQAIDIIEDWVRHGIDSVVIDSVAALTPLAEIEASTEKSSMGTQARLMGQSLRKLTALANKKLCSLIFINQTREKIGVMFGSPETTTGGKALRFYAALRLRTSQSASAKNAIQSEHNSMMGRKEKEKLGTMATIDCRKNKVYRPFLNTEVPIMYGKGYDVVSDAFDWAVAFMPDIVKKSPGGYKLGTTTVKYENMAVCFEPLMQKMQERYGG